LFLLPADSTTEQQGKVDSLSSSSGHLHQSLLSVPATASQEFRFDIGLATSRSTKLLHAASALPAVSAVVSGSVRTQLPSFTAQKGTWSYSP